MTAMYRVQLRLSFLFLTLMLTVLACNLPEVMGLGSTPTPSITPTPTVTQTPTPTPTYLPSSQLQTAEKANFNGEWDRALIEYQKVFEQTINPIDRGSAQLGIGVTLIRVGRFQEAVETLDLFITSYPDHDRLGQGFFHRAQAQEALGRFGEAAQDYQQYLIHRPGLIDAYVQELRGDALKADGDHSAAVAVYKDALQAPQLSSGLEIEIKIAQTYASMGDYIMAISKYSEIYDRTISDYTKAQMDYLRGQAYTALGQIDQAYALYLHAVENYHRSDYSYLGLVALVQAGFQVNELDRGMVDYFAEEYGFALAAFNRYLTTYPVEHDGAVHYYKGLTLRELDRYEDAVNEWDLLIDDHPGDYYWDQGCEQKAYTEWAYLGQYDQAVQTLMDFVAAVPDHDRASEFLYDAARARERSGQLEQAAQLWERLGTDYPNSEWTFRGLFLSGIARYRLNDFKGSQAALQRSLEVAVEPSDRAAVYLWIGKLHQAQGEEESAQAAWRIAMDADPNSYYAIRAEDLLAGRKPFQPLGVFNFDVDLEVERQEAEKWMRATFPITGPEPLSDLDSRLVNDLRMVRGGEFWRLGLYNQARLEFESLRDEYENDAETNYRLMHYFLDLGLYRSAIIAAWQVIHLGGIDYATIEAAPIYLYYIRFAPYFGELILPQALDRGLDGLFLLSVARQESFFESFAISYAGARGLMQVIPNTGQEIFNELGWPPGYTDDDLYRPVVSVRMGSYYLAAQRDRFDGDLYASLAAYNAGPGAAIIWKELAPEDPDLFVEVIRYGQTRDYIRTIYWAYANYCNLYIE